MIRVTYFESDSQDEGGVGLAKTAGRCVNLVGLDPAIHPFRKDAFVKLDGYVGQARV
jgi:hypothetical protein